MTTNLPTPEHVHRYVYQGMQFADGHWPIPGSGACKRYYAHVYFCTGCLVKVFEPAALGHVNGMVEHNTYNPVKFNATPGPRNEIVPQHDRGNG